MHTLVESMKQVVVDARVVQNRAPQLYRLMEMVFSGLLPPHATLSQGDVIALGYLDTNSKNTFFNQTDCFAPFLEQFMDSGENEALIKQAAPLVLETVNQSDVAPYPSVMSTRRELCLRLR